MPFRRRCKLQQVVPARLRVSQLKSKSPALAGLFYALPARPGSGTADRAAAVSPDVHVSETAVRKSHEHGSIAGRWRACAQAEATVCRRWRCVSGSGSVLRIAFRVILSRPVARLSGRLRRSALSREPVAGWSVSVLDVVAAASRAVCRAAEIQSNLSAVREAGERFAEGAREDRAGEAGGWPVRLFIPFGRVKNTCKTPGTPVLLPA